MEAEGVEKDQSDVRNVWQAAVEMRKLKGLVEQTQEGDEPSEYHDVHHTPIPIFPGNPHAQPYAVLK